VSAVRELFDRAWGKPAQELLVAGTMANVDVDVKELGEMDAAERFNFGKTLAYLLTATADHAEREARTRRRSGA
jgi:hypothetical protein